MAASVVSEGRRRMRRWPRESRSRGAMRALRSSTQRRDERRDREGRDRDRGQRAFRHQRNQRLHLAHMRQPDRPHRRIHHGVGTLAGSAARARGTRAVADGADRRARSRAAPSRARSRNIAAAASPSPPMPTSASQLIAIASQTRARPVIRPDDDEECRDRACRERQPVIRGGLRAVAIEHVAQREGRARTRSDRAGIRARSASARPVSAPAANAAQRTRSDHTVAATTSTESAICTL